VSRHLSFALLLLPALPGCATFAFAGHGTPLGFFYTDASAPQHITENEVGKKKGEACASSILGWVTTGDASVRAAADAGGIKQISAVDSSFRNYLGIYATYCTIVSGQG
jgi:hypothetical protein